MTPQGRRDLYLRFLTAACAGCSGGDGCCSEPDGAADWADHMARRMLWYVERYDAEHEACLKKNRGDGPHERGAEYVRHQ